MKKLTYIFSLLVLIFPVFVFAQTRFGGVRSFIVAISGIIQLLLVVVAALALLAFLWGLAKFIMHAGDVKTHAEGRQFMIWGIIALFVMVSVWGIVRFIQLNLGIQSGGIFRIEELNFRTGVERGTWNTGTGGTGGTGSGGTGGTGSGGSGFERPDDEGGRGLPNCGTDSFGNPIEMC